MVGESIHPSFTFHCEDRWQNSHFKLFQIKLDLLTPKKNTIDEWKNVFSIFWIAERSPDKYWNNSSAAIGMVHGGSSIKFTFAPEEEYSYKDCRARICRFFTIFSSGYVLPENNISWWQHQTKDPKCLTDKRNSFMKGKKNFKNTLLFFFPAAPIKFGSIDFKILRWFGKFLAFKEL